KARHLRRKHNIPTRLARCRHRGQRTTMEAVIEGNDFVGAITLDLPPFTGQFDGALVGFGAAIGKEHAVETRRFHNALGQIHGRLVIKSGRRVDQLFGLSLNRLDNHGRAMAQAVHRPALHKVQVPLAVVVFKPGTLPAHEHQFGPRGDVHKGVHASLIKFHVASEKKVKGVYSLAKASSASSRGMTVAYFCSMSNRLASCGARARSPTQSDTTSGRKPNCIASTTLARTQPLVVVPAITSV